MKIEIEKKVGFYEVGSDFTLRFKSLSHFFQDATGAHSDWGGCGIRRLMGRNRAWVLYRTCIRAHRMPCLGDDLKILTWSRGGKGYRAHRDFEVYCKGEKIVSATSLWLFIDIENKKILKVPKEMRDWYTIEEEQTLDMDIDGFQPNLKFDPELSETAGIRPSDFDPLNHVNNAVYLDFLENLIHQAFNGRKKIQEVVIQFQNEITKGLNNIEIGIQQKDGKNDFKLFSPGGVHAAGTFRLFDS